MIDVTAGIDKDFTVLLECYNLKVIMDLFLKIFTFLDHRFKLNNL